MPDTPRSVAERDEQPPSPIESLTDRAAAGERLAEGDIDQLTQFFLGERRSRPGESREEAKDFAVNLATDGSPEEFRCTLHSITWEQWQEAQRLGTDKSRGQDQANQFKTASYAVAYGLVKPDLGAVRMQLPEDRRPKDTAEMLRDFFRHQPGALLDLQAEVLKLSRLSIAESAVREVDAAKN